MKLGVFGGTFNPVHRGHLHLMQGLARSLALDGVLLIPTWSPPHKPARELASPQDRLAMCRLAVQDNPFYRVCDMEVRARATSYTYRTLGGLQDSVPGAQLYLLMGADMFCTVQQWREAPRIYRMAVLCAAAREPGELSTLWEQAHRLQEQGARCRVVELEAKPMSSTQIRAGLREGRDMSPWLDERVYRYIRARGLYGVRQTGGDAL